MANIYPDKGYFEVGTDEQQREALQARWHTPEQVLYNTSTITCHRCEGKGYTRKTRTEVVRSARGSLRTIKQGSGCPVCFGTGKVQRDGVLS